MSIQLFWVWSHTVLFGEPHAPGWITPALPLVIVFLGDYSPGTEAVHAMMAVMLVISVLFLFFGLTGLGDKFNRLVPNTLKAGIIMGAAISAFMSEFDRVQELPFTLISAWVAVLMVLYSIPFQKINNVKVKGLLAANALLVGFIAAGIVGSISGEIQFNIEWGIFIPQFGEMFATLTPYGVGLPSWEMILAAIPMALSIYILVFGDLLVADGLIRSAKKSRPDEKIDVNYTRTHYALTLRNLGYLLTGGAFIPLHGPIWTGVQVYVIERYKQGRKVMDSIFTGTINFHLLALPLGFLMPIISLILPLLDVALSLTLLLTGFACAYLAMSMVSTNVSRGMTLFIGVLTALQGPAWGLGVGVVMYILLMGINGRPPSMKSKYDTKEEQQM
nr:solute carrier family 23 protein [Geomicrobium halophilum]